MIDSEQAAHPELVVQGLRKDLSPTIQVRADFSVTPGERLVLSGPSGSGKTSVLRLVAGLDAFDEGQVWLGTERLDQVAVEKRRIGFVFQEDALFASMTVVENVMAGLRFTRRLVHRALPQGSRAEIEARAMEWLTRVGLADRARSSIDRLSGGERKRVALARTWITRPSVLLLDEPFNGLDGDLKFRLLDELIRLHESWPVPLVLVTHDPEEVRRISTRAIAVEYSDDGKVRHFR